MRHAASMTLALAIVACHNSSAARSDAPAAPAPAVSIPGASFTLTHLDGRMLPTAYADPRGSYTLNAGSLRFDSQGRVWLVLDLVATGEYSSGRTGQHTLQTTYREVGADSVVFPTDSIGRVAEFFGHFRGSQFILVARPTRLAGINSIAREHGGTHTWIFDVH